MSKKKREEERFAALSQIASLLALANQAAKDIGSERACVVATVTGVARSGLSRTIRVFVVRAAGESPSEISSTIARARIAGAHYAGPSEGFRVPGCGMDMVFHTLSSLESALKAAGLNPDGRCDFWHSTL